MALPEPRLIDPGSVPSLRWGLIGSGWIANQFALALQRRSAQRMVAVAGRDPLRAAEFAERYGIARSYPTVEDLLADAEIDVVYIATPHSSHREMALLAIAAGKHILVEKPLATSAYEAGEVVRAAQAAGVLAMEAMWTRYLPQSDVLRQLIAEGRLGEIHQVSADFGARKPYDPAGRMWNPDLAGGALLDLGVYPLSFVTSILGAPRQIQASGAITPDGIDLHATALLSYASASDGVITTSLLARGPAQATVIGSQAHVEIQSPFFAPSGLVVRERRDGADIVETWMDPAADQRYDALSYQATALAGYVGEGRLESPLHPLDEVVTVLSAIEEIRSQLEIVDYDPSVGGVHRGSK